MSKLSSLDVCNIKVMRDSGISVAEIAKFFNCDVSTIYRKLQSEKSKQENDKVIDVKSIKDDIDEDFPKETPVIELDFVCFDLETTNLTADFSIILCACIKPFGKNAIVLRIDDYNSNWSTKRMDDSKLIKAIATELSKHAIVITHYGSKFDLPYLKAKMARYGLSPLNPIFSIDTWRLAKNNFQVSSRRLANMSTYFELGKKSGVEGPLWLKASMNGDKKSLDEIVEHNIQDVILLERLAAISFKYLKAIPKV